MPIAASGGHVRQDRLIEVLSEFARNLATDVPIQGILDHLVQRIVDVLPIDSAGVTLISPIGNFRFVAASDASARHFEEIQVELGQGPCLAAFRTDAPIQIPDLAQDDRFPLYAPRALEQGLAAVFTFPLRDGDQGLGALDLYRNTPGPLDAEEVAAAQTLADVTTAYLLNAQARIDVHAMSAVEREALARLRVLDRTKTEFLATVIHELRTPMTSITGYTELLQEGDAGDLSSTQQRLVAAIERNSDRLTVLADDLLTLASLEEGAVLDEHTRVDLGDVVRTARSSVQTLLDSRSVQVTFDVPTAPLYVHGNARQLERLVVNLLTNALKFTEEGGWVRCVLGDDGVTVRVTVEDNGMGIPEAEQAHLFTRFFRSSTAHEQAIPGSGLGLSIIASIATNHGGTISVVSAPGTGTTFTFDVPLKQPHGAAPTASVPTAQHSGAPMIGGAEDADDFGAYGARAQMRDGSVRAIELDKAINRVDDGVFALDHDWRIRFVNVSGARLVGRTIDDLLGKNLWAEFPTAVGSGFEVRYREALRSQQRVEFEEYFEVLDVWFSVRVYPSQEGVTLVFHDVTPLRALRAERRALLVRLLESENRERARIAAGVHDDSVQALAAVKLQLELLNRYLPDPSPKVEALLTGLGEQIAGAISRLRALLFSLEPTDTDTPIARSIRSEASYIFYASPIHWSVDDLDVGEELPTVERGQALRIAKEALLNVRAHSEASEVIVYLRGDDQGLEVHIADNGRSPDPAAFTSAPGHRGIRTMRDRAAVVGGWCTIEPAAPEGCSVRFFIPRTDQ